MTENNHIKITLKANSADISVIYRLFVNEQLIIERYVPSLSNTEQLVENILVSDRSTYKIRLENLTENIITVESCEINDDKVDLKICGKMEGPAAIIKDYAGKSQDKAMLLSIKTNK
jgi:hypothetical protein